MFTPSLFETPDMIGQHERLNEVSAPVDAGVLRSTLGEHYGRINANNLRRAHKLLESGKARGKIVLEGFAAWAPTDRRRRAGTETPSGGWNGTAIDHILDT